MPVIRVSESTKRELLRYAAELQARLGRRVSLDEAIASLLREARRRPDLLLMACSPAPSPEKMIRELYEERRRDEERAKRKYCV